MKGLEVPRDHLDILKYAHDDIGRSGVYRYADYRRCAVGHVYKAVTGAFAEGVDQVIEHPGTEFQKVMASVNSAIAGRDDSSPTRLSDKALPNLFGEVNAARNALADVIAEIEAAHNFDLSR